MTLDSPLVFVLMGVSGSGKTTIGQRLAVRTGLPFADADDFHPQSNKDKMAAGHPLTDQDRQPWLETLNTVLRNWNSAGQGGILACSALKASYRDTLARDLPAGSVRWVLLDLPREVLTARLHSRHHPFMNPALLDSQLQTLELPVASNAFAICNDRDPDSVVSDILTLTPALDQDQRTSGCAGKETHGSSTL